MAVAFGSFANASSASGTSLVINAPSGLASGDLLIATIGFKSNGFTTCSAPAGWTQLGDEAGDSFFDGAVFRKVATGSEGSDYTFTLSGSQPSDGVIVRYTGVDTTSPINDNDQAYSNSGTVAAPSLTTTEDACMLVGAFIAWNDADPTFTAPSGYDERFDFNVTSNAAFNGGIGIADKIQASAGASGTATPTWSSLSRTISHHIALKPAAGGGGGGVSTTVGAVSAAASVTAIGRSFAHVVGVSAGVASVSGVGANANAGERETVGTSTGQASVVGVGGKDHFSTGTATGVASVSGVGQSEVLTVGNSAGIATVAGVGEAVIAGQAVGTASGIATVSGVASSIAEAVGTSSGDSDASGVNPQVVVTQRLVVGAGGELSWEDHVKAIHEMRMLEGQVKEKKKELKKVVKQLKVVEKQYKQEKAEGILANLYKLEMKKEEIETKIEALEVDLEPLIMAIEKFEIEEDDQEFMMMQ
jgi:hypothetical protein